MSDAQQPLWSDEQIRLAAEQAAANYIESADTSISTACEKKMRAMRDEYEDKLRRLHTTANLYRRSVLDKMDALNLIVEKLGYAGLWDDTDEDADPDPVELVQAARERIAELEAKLAQQQPDAPVVEQGEQWEPVGIDTKPHRLINRDQFRRIEAAGYVLCKRVGPAQESDRQ
jgi:BMFP domain-containing protein YqiC